MYVSPFGNEVSEVAEKGTSRQGLKESSFLVVVTTFTTFPRNGGLS